MIEDRNPIRNLFSLIELVSGEDDSRTGIGQLADDLADHRPTVHVDTTRGLVEEGDTRTGSECHGKGKTLFFPSGQPSPRSVTTLRQTDSLEEFLRVGVRRAPLVQTAVLPDRVERSSTRVDAALLEHDTHLWPEDSTVTHRIESEDPHPARCRSTDPFTHFDRARLASTVRAEDGSDLTRPCIETHTFDRAEISVSNDQILDDERRFVSTDTRKRGVLRSGHPSRLGR